MDEELKIVGTRLKELREERDLTMDMVIADIEAQYGVSLKRGLLSKWENSVNIPTLKSAGILCRYYRVSLDYLMGLTDYRVPIDLVGKTKRGRKKK